MALSSLHKRQLVAGNAPAVTGLYAITPETTDTGWLLLKTCAALKGGTRVLQYRSKGLRPALKREQAQALRRECRKYGACLIVNDDVALAAAIGADGVHLGAEDMGLADARAVLGPQSILGASCYDEISRAERAQAAGADYVAFGSMFSSSTKPNAVRAPLTLLSLARERLRLPVVAIGGITLDNAPLVVAAGADALAVLSALYEAADTRAAARAFTSLFGPGIVPLDPSHRPLGGPS